MSPQRFDMAHLRDNITCKQPSTASPEGEDLT